MIKLVGLILLCTAVGCVGFLFCEKYKNRVRYLEAIKHFSGVCAEQMRFTSKNIFEILKENSDGELDFLRGINSENITDSAKISEVLSTHGIEQRDTPSMSEFIEGLGESDIDGQKTHCGYYFDLFCRETEEARQESQEKGKLYRTLFLFAGAALFILLV